MSKSQGAFTADGAWNPEGEYGPRDAFIRALVRQRLNEPNWSPSRLSTLILQSQYIAMFPNLHQWRLVAEWSYCLTSTEAEWAVKFQYRAPDLKKGEAYFHAGSRSGKTHAGAKEASSSSTSVEGVLTPSRHRGGVIS